MESDASFAGLAAIPVCFFLLIIFSIVFFHRHAKKRMQFLRDRDKLSEWDLQPRLRKMEPGEALPASLGHEFDQLVEKGFRDRVEAEARLEKGERVWLSHFTSNGRLEHWVLITHGHKYELRCTQSGEVVKRDVDEEKGERWTPARSVSGRVLTGYECRIEPGTVDEDRRKMAIARRLGTVVEGLYFSMIGWTSKTKEEVDEAFRKAFSGPSIFSDSPPCFLRVFASSIVVEKAPDWAWLIDSTLSRRRYKPLTNPVALAVLARVCEEKMQGMMKSAGGDVREVLEWKVSKNKMAIESRKAAYVSAGTRTTGFDFDMGTRGRWDPESEEWSRSCDGSSGDGGSGGGGGFGDSGGSSDSSGSSGSSGGCSSSSD